MAVEAAQNAGETVSSVLVEQSRRKHSAISLRRLCEKRRAGRMIPRPFVR